MTGEFQLDGIVPWGRNRAEYAAFFDLAALEPGLRILDCGAGPASFTAEMTRLGRPVVAADPLYQASRSAIAERIVETYESMLQGMHAAHDRFVWTLYGSPERVGEVRRSAMRDFLEDYDAGRAAGRYLPAGLPDLPFGANSFDLVLSSHFLFLYSTALDLEFHLTAVREMLRVGAEARIFPLLDLDGQPARHVDPLCAQLRAEGFLAERVPVAYEFQKGGNEMLRIRRWSET